MPTTRKTPTRLTPGGGEEIITSRAKQTTASKRDRQDVEKRLSPLSLTEIRSHAQWLFMGGDLSSLPAAHQGAVLNYIWGRPWCPPSLRFWKTQEPAGEQLWVEDGGCLRRLGDILVVTSQLKFRRALLKATEHHSRVLIPLHKPATWSAIARCLLKVFELRKEADHA